MFIAVCICILELIVIFACVGQINEMARSLKEHRTEMKQLKREERQIRECVEAQEREFRSLMIENAMLKEKCESERYQLIDLQNKYVSVKRMAEAAAHELANKDRGVNDADKD